MSELTHFERDALRLVSVGAAHIRALSRLLPDSPVARKILVLADGIHNIPKILAGSADERQASIDGIRFDISELNAALGIETSGTRPGTSRPPLTLVSAAKQTGGEPGT